MPRNTRLQMIPVEDRISSPMLDSVALRREAMTLAKKIITVEGRDFVVALAGYVRQRRQNGTLSASDGLKCMLQEPGVAGRSGDVAEVRYTRVKMFDNGHTLEEIIAAAPVPFFHNRGLPDPLMEFTLTDDEGVVEEKTEVSLTIEERMTALETMVREMISGS